MQQAIGCITARRLSVPKVPDFEADRDYGIVLNEGRPVELKGSGVRLLFSAGQNFRIVRTDDEDRGPFKVRTVRYFYQFATRDGTEVLVYHWTPEAQGPNDRTYPHLHVATPMLNPAAPVFAGRFNKIHIPTGRVSLEAVVRLAIEEMGITGKKGWQSTLARTQAAFEQWRTRSA